MPAQSTTRTGKSLKQMWAIVTESVFRMAFSAIPIASCGRSSATLGHVRWQYTAGLATHFHDVCLHHGFVGVWKHRILFALHLVGGPCPVSGHSVV